MALKFKPGDVIKPIPGKSLSNYKRLKTLEEVVFISYDKYTLSHVKKSMNVKVQKGYSEDVINCHTYVKSQTITVYDDAFELLVPEEEDYTIF